MPEASKKGTKEDLKVVIENEKGKNEFNITKNNSLSLNNIKAIPNKIIIDKKKFKTKNLLNLLSEIDKEGYEIKELGFVFEEKNKLISLTIKTKFALPREELAKFYKFKLDYGYIKGYFIPKKEKEDNLSNEEKEDNSYQSITFVPSHPPNFKTR